MTNLIGKEIGGYRILAQIGMGGMAKVYKAYQAKMDRVVALKVLPEHYSKDETFLKRFDQEARIIANLENRNILSVFDYGEDDGVAFLAMRYLRGGTLKDVLNSAENRRLSMTDVAHVVAQLANALDYSHEQGIVHRDMKPSNVLVDENGDCYLTDFGIAKVLDSTSHLTSTGSTLGTPAYMSPEQAAGKNVGTHSDIYSLGIILYELMVGKVPFDSDTPFATVLAHVNEPIPLPSQVNPDIPPKVEQVILKALAKNPEDRYRSARDLSTALFGALEEEEIHVGGHGSLKVSDTLQRLSGGLAQTRPNDEMTVDDIALAKTQQRREMLRKYIPAAIIIIFIGLLGTIGYLLGYPTLVAGGQKTNSEVDPAQAAALTALVTETKRASFMQTATKTYIDQQTTLTQESEDRQATSTVVADQKTQTMVAAALTTSPTPTNTEMPDNLIYFDRFDQHSLSSFNRAWDGAGEESLYETEDENLVYRFFMKKGESDHIHFMRKNIQPIATYVLEFDLYIEEFITNDGVFNIYLFTDGVNYDTNISLQVKNNGRFISHAEEWWAGFMDPVHQGYFTTGFAEGQWFHYLVQYDGETFIIKVDGVEVFLLPKDMIPERYISQKFKTGFPFFSGLDIVYQLDNIYFWDGSGP